MRSYLILTMCGLFLMQYFFPYQWLQYLVVAIVLAVFTGSATKADPFPRWLGIFMMTIGILLEINKGGGVQGISEGILLILPLICLITLAPLLSLPLRLSGYFEAVDSLLRNLVHHPRKLFAGITGTLFLLSPILNLGTVRIIHEFLKDLKLPSVMSAKSYLVGFSTAPLWSPYFASVSLILHYLDIPVSEYIMYGIGLSLLTLLVGNLLFAIWERRNLIVPENVEEEPLKIQHRKQLLRLVICIMALMASSLIIEYITQWSMIVIVCLISISFPLLWGVVSNSLRRLLPPFKDYRIRTVPMLNNEIVLFTSAGLLGYAMQGTSLSNGVNIFLMSAAKQSFLLFAVTLMAIVLIVTYAGIHQIAVISALAMQLNAEELGISSLALAMLLALAWSTSTALSPFSGLNLMVSRFAGISGVEVGLRANGLYLSVVILVGIVIISFVR